MRAGGGDSVRIRRENVTLGLRVLVRWMRSGQGFGVVDAEMETSGIEV
jgi:hypothetical protein